MDESQRFRRALKNPMVVIGLVLIAGFAVYSNVMTVTSDTPGIISVGLNRLLADPAPPPVIRAQRIHEEAAMQWIDHPERDPFSPITVASQPPLESSSTTTLLQAMKQPQLQNGLTLKAVAIEGQDRSAVINRTVVNEGEMIEGYQVMSIQPNGVWLKHQGRTQLLTFSEKTAS
ncbi:MAG: general secretion pathway protein GspB [Nitrospirota bacterium]|jgi:hypothetical protein|nr:general secretion pathway protein GspB [Nitrospirota bacterium]MDH4361164.1 general secretion pathway protein GspB [Nitrospirota bacterium]MDH5574130.1 general secretion pathway protein GspB [Nitrospirota bacterium]